MSVSVEERKSFFDKLKKNKGNSSHLKTIFEEAGNEKYQND